MFSVFLYSTGIYLKKKKRSSIGVLLRSWFKGADTVVVLKFLSWKYERILGSSIALGAARPYLQDILKCLQHSNEFMSALYKSGLFLARLRLNKIVRHGRQMLSLYSRCAAGAYQKGLARFKYNPKFHMLAHIILDLQRHANNNVSPLNPLAASCQMPEDFINRVSTLSRGVHSKLVATRTIDLYRISVAHAW